MLTRILLLLCAIVATEAFVVSSRNNDITLLPKLPQLTAAYLRCLNGKRGMC